MPHRLGHVTGSAGIIRVSSDPTAVAASNQYGQTSKEDLLKPFTLNTNPYDLDEPFIEYHGEGWLSQKTLIKTIQWNRFQSWIAATVYTIEGGKYILQQANPSKPPPLGYKKIIGETALNASETVALSNALLDGYNKLATNPVQKIDRGLIVAAQKYHKLHSPIVQVDSGWLGTQTVRMRFPDVPNITVLHIERKNKKQAAYLDAKDPEFSPTKRRIPSKYYLYSGGVSIKKRYLPVTWGSRRFIYSCETYLQDIAADREPSLLNLIPITVTDFNPSGINAFNNLGRHKTDYEEKKHLIDGIAYSAKELIETRFSPPAFILDDDGNITGEDPLRAKSTIQGLPIFWEGWEDFNNSLGTAASEILPLEEGVLPSTTLEVKKGSVINNSANKAQAIINSDRVVVNAKEDYLFLCGELGVSISSKEPVNIDTDSTTTISATNGIYLGVPNNGAPYDFNNQKQPVNLSDPTRNQQYEPVVLGQKLNKLLTSIFNTVKNAVISTSVGATSYFSSKTQQEITEVQGRLPETLSTTVFVDGVSHRPVSAPSNQPPPQLADNQSQQSATKAIPITNQPPIQVIQPPSTNTTDTNTNIPTVDNIPTTDEPTKLILIGGLDDKAGYKLIDSQVDLVKDGLKLNPKYKNLKVEGYRYTNDGQKPGLSLDKGLAAISNAPNSFIFLFSAGAAQALTAATRVNNKKIKLDRIFIIEPYYSEGGNTTKQVRAAVKMGVPAKNVFVGTYAGVGLGIIDNPSKTPKCSPGHWCALIEVARLLK